MKHYAIITILSSSMVLFFVLSSQPWMIVNEVKWVGNIIVDVTYNVCEEDKKFENSILDEITNTFHILYCHFRL